MRLGQASSRHERSDRSGPDGKGFWHSPGAMNMVALMLNLSVLIGVASLVYRVLVQLPLLPARELVVMTPLNQVTVAQLEYAARSSLTGNFFAMELGTVRRALETLPWVRRADVRRLWLGALEVRLEEHQPVAYWRNSAQDAGDLRLVNRQGEVFAAAADMDLPVLAGPEGSAPLLLEKYAEYAGRVSPIGRLVELSMSPRRSWQLKLANGLTIELGREQSKVSLEERLVRFVKNYEEARQKSGVTPVVADLRHAGGFALRSRDAAVELRGKP